MCDVAVLASVDASAQPLAICTARMCDSDVSALCDAFMQVRFSVACMDAIPRTAGAKIRRGNLNAIVDAAFRPADRAA